MFGQFTVRQITAINFYHYLVWSDKTCHVTITVVIFTDFSRQDCPRGKRRYLGYSDVDFEACRPAAVTHYTHNGEIRRGGVDLFTPYFTLISAWRVGLRDPEDVTFTTLCCCQNRTSAPKPCSAVSVVICASVTHFIASSIYCKSPTSCVCLTIQGSPWPGISTSDAAERN